MRHIQQSLYLFSAQSLSIFIFTFTQFFVVAHAAVATAVQNIHIQACTRFPQLACYWSSWHSAARDSIEMKQFLKLKNINEDKCMGFFIIAQKDPTRCSNKDRRKRDNSTNSLMSIEWRE